MSAGASAAVGLLTAGAVLTARPTTARSRVAGAVRSPSAFGAAGTLARQRAGQPADSLRSNARLLVALGGGGVLALVMGGVVGLLLGSISALLLHRWLRGLEPGDVRRRRLSLTADLPWAADLLAAAVEGGATLERALRAVADAVGGPLGGELRSVAAAFELGASPGVAWGGVDPVLAGVGRSFVRAADHGTPAADHIERLADDLRAAARAESAAAVRAAGVHALAPLGACFLPAFLLLAVLPMVAGVASQLLR